MDYAVFALVLFAARIWNAARVAGVFVYRLLSRETVTSGESDGYWKDRANMSSYYGDHYHGPEKSKEDRCYELLNRLRVARRKEERDYWDETNILNQLEAFPFLMIQEQFHRLWDQFGWPDESIIDFDLLHKHWNQVEFKE